MYGLKSRINKQVVQYLRVIRPWAMGTDQRGWVQADFYMPNPENPEGQWVSKKDVYEYRTDPSHVIFPLVPFEISLLDRLFMKNEVYVALLNLNQTISNFNAMLAAFESAQTAEDRWVKAVMLHTGLIGTTNTGGLYDRFRLVEVALRG
jgi:hypothetical protein